VSQFGQPSALPVLEAQALAHQPGLQQTVLLLQKCDDIGRLRMHPAARCSDQSLEWEHTWSLRQTVPDMGHYAINGAAFTNARAARATVRAVISFDPYCPQTALNWAIRAAPRAPFAAESRAASLSQCVARVFRHHGMSRRVVSLRLCRASVISLARQKVRHLDHELLVAKLGPPGEVPLESVVHNV
jgi:hypothetical protein